MHINDLLSTSTSQGASDLHLKVGALPILRINGELVLQKNMAVISAEAMERLFVEITTEKQRQAFNRDLEADWLGGACCKRCPGICRDSGSALPGCRVSA